MTPPRATDPAPDAEMSKPPLAVLSFAPGHKPVLQTLQHRPDFLRAAQARKCGAGSFLLQARDRADGTPAARVGFTASKKIGNAVARNRAKRRLRALAREVLAPRALPGWDYVLVARPDATIARLFADLKTDLIRAIDQVHRGRP